MPTFSIPVPLPVPADKMIVSKKPRDRKKTPAPAPAPEEPAPEEPAPEEPAPEEPEQEPEQEPEPAQQSPTFPDMVILKQTEHNYIVKHNHYPIMSSTHNNNNNNTSPFDDSIHDLVSPNQIHKGQINKKRGRKPKAGFILNSSSGLYDTSEVPNIILHLKCHLSDLKTNESISNYGYTPAISEVESYTLMSNYLQSSDITQPNNDNNSGDNNDEYMDDNECIETICHGDESNDTSAASASAASASASAAAASASAASANNSSRTSINQTANDSHTNNVSIKRIEATEYVVNQRNHKEIMKKINRLKYSFHNGETIQTKLNHKSACFWDTCEFDGPIYYIPIMIVNGIFQVSGCYCSPECAVAALLKEPLDTSSKFERLHLLHLLYGTPSGKGFKPAPNPNYLLDKYYGNLTIQEYRSLLKSPQMIHIVNKPLTHILPELYEDNNDFLVNSKVIPTNSLKMKKRYKTMVVQGSVA
jgi:hypothetical protein